MTGNGAHSRILIMDDEPAILRLTQRLLTRIGYHVDTAPEGNSAIEVFESAHASGEPYDLFIADLTVVGGMGGQEALQHIRRIDPRIKALVSSGHPGDPVMVSPECHGFMGVIEKPFTAEILKIAVLSALSP